MTTKTFHRPAALVSLLDKARTKPVELPEASIDASSTIRRESLGDMPIGELLALTGYNRSKEHTPHRLQRDTESRLEAVRRTAHLRCSDSVPTPQHQISLVWFNKKLEVVDGNSRLMLWSGHTEEEVLVPASVLVTMYYPDDEVEYDLLYRCYDSNDSRKTNQDNLFGIMHANGITPKSGLLRKNKVVSAICMAAGEPHSPEGLFNGVQQLTKELTLLDSYGFSAEPRTSYGAGVYAGLLSVLKKGSSKPAVAAFAKELRQCREVDGYTSPSPAVQEFMAAYPEAKSVSAGTAVKRVRELIERVFVKYEAEFEAASGKQITAKARASTGRAKAQKAA